MQETKKHINETNTTAILIWGTALGVIVRASDFTGAASSKEKSFAALFIVATLGCLAFAWIEFGKNEDPRDSLFTRAFGVLGIVVGSMIFGLVFSTPFFT